MHQLSECRFRDGVSKEIVSRFTTKLASKQKYYTDSNGRQILKRRIADSRESFQLNITDPFSGNYYPINSRISIKDETTEIDRSFAKEWRTDAAEGAGRADFISE